MYGFEGKKIFLILYHIILDDGPEEMRAADSHRPGIQKSGICVFYGELGKFPECSRADFWDEFFYLGIIEGLLNVGDSKRVGLRGNLHLFKWKCKIPKGN